MYSIKKIPSGVNRPFYLEALSLVSHSLSPYVELITDLDAYARTVAHDLRNPLSVVMGCVDHMQQIGAGDLTQRLSEKLDVIRQSTRKMTSIINELLLLASVRKKKDIHYESLDMNAIVSSALTRLTARIEGCGAQINLPDTWPVSIGYAPWVEEVWINYLSNALKYGGDPPMVTLGYTEQKDWVQYWVQDNGPGLNEDEQSAVFSEFTRLERNKHIDGYGLGLTIVETIMDSMGGEASVESEPGQGSRFSFTLAVPQ